MRPPFIFAVVFSIMIIMSYDLFAQASTTIVTQVAPDKEREQNFIHNVKVIDEFMERFNDDKSSYLRQVYKSKKHHFDFTRRKLILNLFDTPRIWADKPDVKQFITQVTDSSRPQLLSLTDSNWYARVACQFTTNGREVTIPLILQVVVTQDSGVTWMITGIADGPLFTHTQQVNKSSKVKEEPISPKKAISPTDYATNFLALHRVLTPVMNPKNYFMPALLRTERGTSFVQMIKDRTLKFEHTQYPRFYFFQIPNFAFVVEHFNRQTTNSGWLINKLAHATDAQKAVQKSELLERPL